jgi:hypothetical protein
MRTYTGRVVEIQLDQAGRTAAQVACPAQAVPSPGQYTFALDENNILGAPLFLGRRLDHGFLAAPPLPAGWAPGLPVTLRGPLGRGFHLPADLRRLALAAAGETAARLLPLAEVALERNVAVTLFTDAPLPALPLSLEAYPLGALPEARAWADFLALDLPLESLPELRERLGLPDGGALDCPGQALILAPMPCAGLADCGVCAVPAPRSWKLACKDGPVFDLTDLLA